MKQQDLKELLDIKDYQGNSFFLAFTVLRFVATCLITNTHYNDVYPIQSLAVGGLLGDVLFFIVSGFVLAKSSKDKFLVWYGKRLLRIYPTIVAGVLLYWVTGYSDFKINLLFETMVFPTAFVFVGAIIILYIPYFFFSKIHAKIAYLLCMGGVIAIWIITYVFVLDKSTYLMNSVTNPMILFPYLTSMLIGGYIRKFGLKHAGKLKIFFLAVLSLWLLVGYFITNNVIRGNSLFNLIQIVVPFSLLLSAASVAYLFYLLENWFRRWPAIILNVINFIAALTLEIYVVQKPLIDAMSSIVFPLNWLLITISIVVSAVIVRIVVNFVKKSILGVVGAIRQIIIC